MLVIQKVVEALEINKDAIIKGIADVLKIVFASENETYIDCDETNKKINNLKCKIQRLLDLYLSEDLTKEAYREKKAEYEKEIARLEKLLNGAKNNTYEYDADAAVKDVCEYIKKILYATERDEVFYKNLVEKIVVHSRERIDVYLNLLPHKWSVVLNSALEQSDLCGSISGTTYLYRLKDPC